MESYGLNSPTNFSTSSDGKTEPNSSSQSSETPSESRVSFLNSPEWLEMSQSYQEWIEEWTAEMRLWWENLPAEQQQWAFYNVCRLIYKGDVEDRRSYRGVLYDVFGWDESAYVLGMEAHYMELHNLLGDGVEHRSNLPQWEIDEINEELEDAAEHDASQA